MSQFNLCLELPKQEKNWRATVNFKIYDGFAQPYLVNKYKCQFFQIYGGQMQNWVCSLGYVTAAVWIFDEVLQSLSETPCSNSIDERVQQTREKEARKGDEPKP